MYGGCDKVRGGYKAGEMVEKKARECQRRYEMFEQKVGMKGGGEEKK